MEMSLSECCGGVQNLVLLLDMLAEQMFPYGCGRPTSEIATRLPGKVAVMPHYTAFEVLTVPLTGYGCGKGLRFSAVM